MRWIYYSFLYLVSMGLFAALVVVAAVSFILNQAASDLPAYSQLKDYEPPVITRVHAGDGRLLAEFAQEKRVFVPIDEIPQRVKNAFISAEDKNFYTHMGVDSMAILRAALTNFKNIGRGRRLVGASTITQQVAKNFLLTNEVSYTRKIKEAILAYRMERVLSKDRLLELYLNQIFLGNRSYGVAAASLNYFSKSLDELDISEAAYLAALPKAPNNYHPIKNHDKALARRNWVIDRMKEDGYITESQAEIAKAKPLEMRHRKSDHIINAPYFAEEVRRVLIKQYGENILYDGGLSVRTSVDPDLQKLATQSLRKGLMAYDQRHGWRGPLKHLDNLANWAGALETIEPSEGMLDEWKMAVVLSNNAERTTIGLSGGVEAKILAEDMKWAGEKPKTGDVIYVELKDKDKNLYNLRQVPAVQGAIIALDPHTGRVLAMQGGWKFDKSEFNRATQAWRQPGSAFKPFVYLTALEYGFTPATLILDAPFVIEDRPGNFWRPENYSKNFSGPTPLRKGIEKSKNLMTVRLADYIGMDRIVEQAKKFGIVDDMEPMLSYSLGAAETTLFRLTTAYTMLVNGGKRINPTFIDRIQDRYGHVLFQHDKRPCAGCGDLIKWQQQDVPKIPDIREQIADPRRVYQIVSILEGVVKRGTARRLASLGRPLAGKTGTTNESKDTWFMGFSPDLVVGVFVGFDDPKPLGYKETGSSVSAPIFKLFMEEALKDVPPTPFRVPPGIRMVQINAETGQRAQPGDKNVIWESFIAGSEPNDKIFVLDTGGVSEMPSLPDDPSGTGYNYNGSGTTPYVTPDQSAITGTGGLY